MLITFWEVNEIVIGVHSLIRLFIPAAVVRQSFVIDRFIEKAKDSYLVSLGERCRGRIP